MFILKYDIIWSLCNLCQFVEYLQSLNRGLQGLEDFQVKWEKLDHL